MNAAIKTFASSLYNAAVAELFERGYGFKEPDYKHHGCGGIIVMGRCTECGKSGKFIPVLDTHGALPARLVNVPTEPPLVFDDGTTIEYFIEFTGILEARFEDDETEPGWRTR